MTLEILGHPYAYEMECLARLFYPGERIVVACESGGGDAALLTTRMEREGDDFLLYAAARVDGPVYEGHDSFTLRGEKEADWGWEVQRRLSALFFDALCRATGSRPPWGVLTGVRPVSFCRKLTRRFGLSEEQLKKTLAEGYRVLPNKAELALRTMKAQRDILAADTSDSYSLYVGIPFCPSRCLYCSFVSHAIASAAKLAPGYLRLLGEELAVIGELADRLGLKLRSVYVGGGTPTTLEPGQLRALLEQLEKSFPIFGISEYTVEAGRPDSITREKLKVLKDFGVSRISVNPQTMDDSILKAIGRGHTAAQTRDAMALARETGFNNINMDLIVGLPGQTPESFSSTLEEVLSMGPENVTVHTLTVKRSSALRWQEDAFERNPYSLDDMLEFSQRRLKAAGYFPYYLYRQQGTRQNLENIGYSLPGREGLYNIYSMEDSHTILAAGAGGVTKLCSPPDRIKRMFNYKYPYEYIDGFETLISRKQAVTSFYRESPGAAGRDE